MHLLDEKDVVYTFRVRPTAKYINEIVVLKPTALNETSQTAINQLWLVMKEPRFSSGTTWLKHIVDGDILAVHQSDIIGPVKGNILVEVLKHWQNE